MKICSRLFLLSGFCLVSLHFPCLKGDHSHQLCHFDDKKLPCSGDQEAEISADHFEEPALCLPYAPLMFTSSIPNNIYHEGKLLAINLKLTTFKAQHVMLSIWGDLYWSQECSKYETGPTQ